MECTEWMWWRNHADLELTIKFKKNEAEVHLKNVGCITFILFTALPHEFSKTHNVWMNTCERTTQGQVFCMLERMMEVGSVVWFDGSPTCSPLGSSYDKSMIKHEVEIMTVEWVGGPIYIPSWCRTTFSWILLWRSL